MRPISDWTDDASEDLARWLQEAGRRPGRRLSASEVPPQQGDSGRLSIGKHLHRFRAPLWLALFAVAFLQYIYLDAMTRVSALPAIVFFVAVS